MKNNKRPIALCVCFTAVAMMTGCQSTAVDPSVATLAPMAFQTPPEEEQTIPLPPSDWLASFTDPNLIALVDIAIRDNFEINEANARLEAARQGRIIAGSSLWPSLSLDLDGQRRKSNNTGQNDYNNNFTLGASLSWELDLWGRLRDGAKSADYQFQAQQAQLTAAQLSLAGQVAKAWYNLQAQQELLRLYRERVNNLTTNLDIIERGYRQGINDALDVYLARSDLASENNNLYAQETTFKDVVRQLQLLLGRYPSGDLSDLPAEPAPGLPELPIITEQPLNASSVRYRYDLQSSFLQLLAADRDLAEAHKARFPAFRLTASGGESSNELNDLLSGQSLTWNLLANLSVPLFTGGRLKAAEEQQRQVVRQTEQQYLQALHVAFSEVEQAITNEQALYQRLEQVGQSSRFAEAAKTIAFDEYRKGLSEYTTVLEAQRRAFAAQNTLLILQNQLLQNRITLFLALGGHYQ